MVDRPHVYNRIFNEEEWMLVNSENKEIMIDFLEEYKQRKMKPTTLSQYENDIRIIMLFIYKFYENKNILSLDKRAFRKLSIWLSDECGMSNARTNRLMSCCRSMLTYIEDSDEYEYAQNLAKKVKGLPKEAVRTDDDCFFISFEQIIKIRAKLIEMDELQLAVLMMIMFDSAGRRNEVAQIQKYGLIEKNSTNVITGKRGKQFPLIYLNDTKELIKLWLEKRGADDADSLWIVGSGENKHSASYENLYDWVMKIRKVFSDLEGHEICIFPHSFRHSRIECLLQGTDSRILDKNTGLPKKFSLEEVQLFAHHSDPKTTQDYSKDHSEETINSMFDF
jgi:integrase